MDRANRAIAASKTPSRFNGDDFDQRSIASKASMSHVSKRSNAQAAASDVMSKSSMRSAAQDLVQTLQVQLEHER